MAWKASGVWGLCLLACGAEQPRPPTPIAAPPLPTALGSVLVEEDKPARARLLLLRGEASENAQQPQAAAEAYVKAIELAPEPRYFLRLAELYRTFRADGEAEIALQEGLRVTPAEREHADARGRMALDLAELTRSRGDAGSTAWWLSRAHERVGWLSAPLVFELAAGYVTGVKDGPALDAAKAQELFARFIKLGCHPAVAADYKSECERAASWLRRLAAVPPAEPSVAATPPVGRTGPPRVPLAQLSMQPLQVDGALTVWGAGFSLRSRLHRAEVTNKRVAITGYVTKSNLAEAPRCAVHRPGIADPDDCRSPIPAFWIGDTRDASPGDSIVVLGWAANFSQIFGAIEHFDAGKEEPYLDAYWGTVVPNPLPAVGAKVTARGSYGTEFKKASSGNVVDRVMGILDLGELETLEPASQPATLPGVKRKR
jgi:hypothetical protein